MQRVVALHAANLFYLGARDRLTVRNDRERLHGRLRQLARVPRQHVALNELEKPHHILRIQCARRQLHLMPVAFERKAALIEVVLVAQLNQRILYLMNRHIQRLGQVLYTHRLARDEENRLDAPGKIAALLHDVIRKAQLLLVLCLVHSVSSVALSPYSSTSLPRPG